MYELEVAPDALGQLLERGGRRVRRRHARLVQEEVALLYGLVVHEGEPSRLRDDACLAQLEQALVRLRVRVRVRVRVRARVSVA